MLPSKLRAAVLQATTFYMFTLVFDHHHGASVWDPFLEDEGFQNMSYVLGNLSALNSTGSRPSMLAIDAEAGVNTTLPLINGTGRVGNWTSGNSTTSAREELPDEDFYTQILPRKFVVSLILYALQYYWFIFLEKMLPARPRRRLVAYQHDEKVEETEDREEEVVKKWLAQGRVRRASLNWCNTFLKWVLQVTMGRPAHVAVAFLIEDIILRRSAKQILSDFKFNLIYGFLGNWFTTKPLTDLIAFIIIPVHKQVIFVAGARMIMAIFFTTVARVIAAWAVNTDFVQTFMRDATRGAEEAVNHWEYKPHGEL